MIAHVVVRLSRRAALNLWRTPLPSLLAVLTIALALFLGAGFGLAIAGARSLVASWGVQARLTVYLQPGSGDEQSRALSQRIRALHPGLRVAPIERAQALSQLKLELGSLATALDALPQNPLPASVEIEPLPGTSADEVRALSARLAALPGVVEVDYGREWLDRLEALLKSLHTFGLGALGAVLGAAVLVVANTIRLAVYARRDEIEIMKLVGATDRYVRTPFLLEGALQGLSGAAIALCAFLVLQRWVLPRALQSFAFAAGLGAVPRMLPEHAAVLLCAGAAVGLLGSWIAVTRFLRT